MRRRSVDGRFKRAVVVLRVVVDDSDQLLTDIDLR